MVRTQIHHFRRFRPTPPLFGRGQRHGLPKAPFWDPERKSGVVGGGSKLDRQFSLCLVPLLKGQECLQTKHQLGRKKLIRQITQRNFMVSVPQKCPAGTVWGRVPGTSGTSRPDFCANSHRLDRMPAGQTGYFHGTNGDASTGRLHPKWGRVSPKFFMLFFVTFPKQRHLHMREGIVFQSQSNEFLGP